MTIDTLLVAAIVAAAVAVLARRAWRRLQAARRPQHHCTDCGCDAH